MNFEERLYSHYRLAILLSLIEEPAEARLRYAVLRVLSRIPGRSANVSMLATLLPAYGFAVGRDEVEATVAWCDRARLVKAAEDDGVLGGLLLDLGRDVVAGRATVPGVAPAPTFDWLQRNLEAKSIRLGMPDVIAHWSWCAERRLATCDDHDDGALFITPLGIDVAMGRSEVEGIQAPSTSTIMRLAGAAAATRLGG